MPIHRRNRAHPRMRFQVPRTTRIPSFGSWHAYAARIMGACGALRTWADGWLIDCLPGTCLICGDHAGRALCSWCDAVYWSIEAAVQRCPRCGIRCPAAGVPCGRCQVAKPAFDRTLALADYRPPLDAVAIALKFRARPALAIDLARRLGDKLLQPDRLTGRELPGDLTGKKTGEVTGEMTSDMLRDRCAPARRDPHVDRRDPHVDRRDLPDLLLPVPLSSRRLAERGYNQAWELTRRLAVHAGIPAHPTLLIRAHAAAQAGLDRQSRQRNMRAAISLSRAATSKQPGSAPSPVLGRHVGVVDDVMTTGATFDAVARVLKAAGARRVTNLVVFRTA